MLKTFGAFLLVGPEFVEAHHFAGEAGESIDERRVLSGCVIFALTTCFKWKCYAYGTQARMTLYNWEGEIFDFWTNSETKKEQFRSIMQEFKLEEIVDESEGS